VASFKFLSPLTHGTAGTKYHIKMIGFIMIFYLDWLR